MNDIRATYKQLKNHKYLLILKLPIIRHVQVCLRIVKMKRISTCSFGIKNEFPTIKFWSKKEIRDLAFNK